MTSPNTITLEGRCLAEPTYGYTARGTKTAAVEVVWLQEIAPATENGKPEVVEQVFPCVAIGVVADALEKQVQEHSRIFIQGRLSARGGPLKVVIESFTVLGGERQAGSGKREAGTHRRDTEGAEGGTRRAERSGEFFGSTD